MIIVEYNPFNGVAVADGNAISTARQVMYYERRMRGGNVQDQFFSTENVIFALRLLVRLGQFDHRELVFRYEKQLILVDHAGNLDGSPAGFCDVVGDLLEKLVFLAPAKKPGG
jgi:hypothetical protein